MSNPFDDDNPFILVLRVAGHLLDARCDHDDTLGSGRCSCTDMPFFLKKARSLAN